MGITFSSCQGVKETAQDVQEKVAVEAQGVAAAVADAAEGVVEKVRDVEEAAQDPVAAVAGALTDVAEKVVDVAEVAQDKIHDAGEAAKDKVDDAAEAVAEAAKKAAEVANSTIDAAVAAVTGVMVVEFCDEKGAIKQVSFARKALGFTLALRGGGCCGPKGQAKVVVAKLDKNGQAEKLGVKRNWVLKTVNGTEATGLEQAQTLLAEHAARLPEA